MSEVYVLVKQVPGRPNGEVTLHGVTDSEEVQEAWSSANDNCYAVYYEENEVHSAPWELEQEDPE